MTEATFLERSQHRLSEDDLGRRLVHVAGTAFPALLVVPFIKWWQIVGLMLAVTVATLILEVARLGFGLHLFLFDYLREYEENSPAAYLLFMGSASTVAVAFEPRIAIPAILMLTLADPIAGTASVGELRRVKRPRALATMYLACALLALPFLHEDPLAVVLGGFGGMIADGVKPTVRGMVIDDDLTIAPVGAAGIWLGLELGGAFV
jgi:dolichol kinase